MPNIARSILYRPTADERQQMEAIKDRFGVPYQVQINLALREYLARAQQLGPRQQTGGRRAKARR